MNTHRISSCQPGSVPVERDGDPEGHPAVGHQRRRDGPTPSPRPGHAPRRGEQQLLVQKHISTCVACGHNASLSASRGGVADRITIGVSRVHLRLYFHKVRH